MDQFEGQVLYVEVKTLEMAMALVKEGFKLGGGIAKAGLLLVLDKVKETKKNKAGLVSLKELLRGEDGVSSFTVKDTMRDSLEKQFTEMGIKYGCVENTDSKEVRFFIEDRRLSLVKSILEDMVKNEEIRLKKESTIKNFVKNVNDENIDIKDINDKEINYRHKVENIDKDTALILKDELTKNDIKSELIITGINKDNSLNVEYKVKAEHKEKCVKAINEYIKRFADLNKVENVKKENTIDKIISRAKTMADSINNKNKEQIKEKVKRVPIRER